MQASKVEAMGLGFRVAPSMVSEPWDPYIPRFRV